jgi:hypothetical protein
MYKHKDELEKVLQNAKEELEMIKSTSMLHLKDFEAYELFKRLEKLNFLVKETEKKLSVLLEIERNNTKINSFCMQK